MLDLRLEEGRGSRLLIAGDWMQFFSYIEWDGETLSLLRYTD